MENSSRYDITIIFEGDYEKRIPQVDYEDMTYALSTYYSDNFYIFNKFNSGLKEDEEMIVNLSQIRFIQINKKEKK